VVFNFCLYGALFCLAIDLHEVRGLDALDTGLALLPMTIVTGGMAFISGRVVACAGEWPVILIGLAAGATGALLVALNTSGGPLAALIVSSVPLGFTALAMPAMTAVAMNQAPGHRVGLASGVFNASRQTGGAVGVAVLGALLVAGGNSVSLHIPFVAIAGSYGAGMALALAGHRHSPQHHLTPTPTPRSRP
jgi:MFS transporter, DHA2 family, methylenomycin A resistance protein